MPLHVLGLALLLSASAFGTQAFAFRCDGQLVDRGESKVEVLIKCGDPDWKTQWAEDVVKDAGSVYAVRFSVEKEQWLYNLGPQRFMRLLLFENGRLSEISQAGKGYVGGQTPGPCDVDEIKIGMTAYGVRMECGDPLFVDSRSQEVTVGKRDQHLMRVVHEHIEEWTYNFGPTHFLRTLVFQNGHLTAIRTGERGFVPGTEGLGHPD